jgi:hypothetical protein
METTLTSYQEKLIKELSAEFKKLNPKEEKVGGTNKFTLNTILACTSEEQNFKETVKKQNKAISLLLDKELKKQIKDFEKEFGKIAKVQLGTSLNGIIQKHDSYENMLNTCGGEFYGSSAECYFNIVSKTKGFSSSDRRYDYCNGMAYMVIYLSYRTITDTLTLASGKVIRLERIVGFTFSLRDWLHKKEAMEDEKANTLDELIQKSKRVQQDLVRLS